MVWQLLTFSMGATPMPKLPRSGRMSFGRRLWSLRIKPNHTARDATGLPLGCLHKFFSFAAPPPDVWKVFDLPKAHIFLWGYAPPRLYLAKTVLLARRLPVCFNRVRRKTWGRSPRK